VSVTNTFRVDTRPYSGYADPSLPIASWIAQGGSAGDASGGQIFMEFNFQLNGLPHVSEMYNLEMFVADTSTSSGRECILETRNMDALAPQRPLTDQRWEAQTRAASGVPASAFELDSTQLPIWLGAPNRVEGDSGLRIQWPNIDLVLFLVTLQGYIWGPRSVLAPGGPQRPPNGFFGR